MAEFLCNSQNNGISDAVEMGKAKEPIQGHMVADTPDKSLYSEVLTEFTDWFFSTSLEDLDEELLDAYLEELDELSPIENFPDSQASLEGFHERFSSLFGEQKEAASLESPRHQVTHFPRSLKKLGIVAAIIVVVFGLLVTAQAIGIDVLGAIGRWTEDTFRFASTFEEGEQESIVTDANTNQSEYLDLLHEALNKYGIDGDIVPKWFPEQFELSEPEIIETKRDTKIYLTLRDSEERFLNFSIIQYHTPSDLGSLTFEKDNSFVEQYISGQLVFYILSNNDSITATWSDGLLVEKISGNLTLEEIKTIIDSIGGD